MKKSQNFSKFRILLLRAIFAVLAIVGVLVAIYFFGRVEGFAVRFWRGGYEEGSMFLADSSSPLSCLAAFVPFPQTKTVLREGENAIEAPEPKYQDRAYLDVNLEKELITLFDKGEVMGMYRIAAHGNPRTAPTPKGEFTIKTKEEKHFSRRVSLWMPWSMQVVGDYFIHGWPYYPGGKLYQGKYSRGCVRVPTEKQKELYEKITVGTPVVIY